MEQKHTLWVVGDSTLSGFQDQYYYPRYGYGTQLQRYLKDFVTVQNLALSGRSSKSFLTEPEYQTLLSGMQPGDFLLIGFGHNDEKADPARYTGADADESCAGSFAWTLLQDYIRPAEKAGCKVVLCTPIVRRTQDGTWADNMLHITTDVPGYPGGDYPEAVRKLGVTHQIPVIDMTELTRILYEKLTPAQTIYLHAWTSDRDLSVDNTHTNIWGGSVNAFLVCQEAVRQQIPEFSDWVSREQLVFPEKETTLVSNPAYHPVQFSPDLPQSSLWKDIGIWKGTAFGDLGVAPTREHFCLEETPEGAMHLSVGYKHGKIATSSDGIAMYYTTIPAGKAFTLTASVHILDYLPDGEVSFGLMARDDVYIDQCTASLLGDYVAAGPLHLDDSEAVWNCFARKSGSLKQGGTCHHTYRPGDTVSLKLTGTSDGYACYLGEEEPVTGGFDFQLTAIDPEHVYVGMFAARQADVLFTDIRLQIED